MTELTPFNQLSGMLRPFAKDMIVKHDTDTHYYLEEALSSNKPQMFAAAQIKKNYTSFHLFPVYVNPELLDDIPEHLRKRRQGKSCFNFTKVEQIPMSDLESLLHRAFASLQAS